MPPTPVSLACPACGQYTDSLKSYGFPKWCVILLAIILFRSEKRIACPACTRKYVWRKMLLNIIPLNVPLSVLLILAVKGNPSALNIFLANIILVFAIVPWAIGVTIASYTRGHSKSVVEGKL